MSSTKEYDWEKIDYIIEDAINAKDAESFRGIIVATIDELDADCGLECLQEQVIALGYRIFEKLGIVDKEMYTSRYIKFGRTPHDFTRWMDIFSTEALVRRNNLTSNVLLIRDILEYMSKNIDNMDLSLNLISDRFNVSYSHLSRMFKQYLGRTYGDILSDIRLAHMVRYMYETPLKDRDIGLKIGIDDPHYLSIWFKKMMGYSVSEYRKKYLIV